MKRFFKYVGLAVFAVVFTLYLEFLFVLPKVVDLNVYKWELQQLVKEQAKLDVNFENAKILTTPLLGVGLSAEDIRVKLPDGTLLFSADKIKTRVALPSLLVLTVKVSCAEIENPKINLEIKDGRQFKIVSLIEEILNEQENNLVVKTNTPPPFDYSLIRIKVPAVKISNYNALVNDLKSRHSLTLKGEELLLGYNVNKFKIKTNAKLLSDDKTNITANLDIDSFVPPMTTLDEDDDPAQRVEIPFVNPVLVYRDYNLKSNADVKLKIRMHKKTPFLNGYINVNGTSMELLGLELPKSSIYAKFRGTLADLDTNLFITKDENIKLKGRINYGKNPMMDLKVTSQKIYFNDVITLSKAFLDTLHVQNGLAQLQTQGYLTANADIKTNFKKLNSKGSIIVRGGNITDEKNGLKISGINANIIFKDNLLNLSDTHANINGADIKAEGSINDKSVADISVFTKNMPLTGLYRTFAPQEIKNSVALNSADLSLDTKITGELKEAKGKVNIGLDNLSVTDKNSGIAVTNASMLAEINSDFKNIYGSILNKDFRLRIPQTGSVIYNPLLSIDISDKDVTVNRTEVKINNSSIIRIAGQISDYTKSPYINIKAEGGVNTSDLKQFAGKDAAPFINSAGIIPVKFYVNGTDKKQTILAQIFTDSNNFITPVNIRSLAGKRSLFQAKIDLKGSRLNIKDTGIYTKISSEPFSEDYEVNMGGVKEVVGISGTITNLDTPEPFINILRITIPKELHGDIYAFKDSAFTLDGGLLAFGNALAPRTRGNFRLRNLNIPDLYLTMAQAVMTFKGKSMDINADDIFVNGSDMKVYANIDLNPSSVLVVPFLRFTSDTINVDRLMKAAESAAKFAPAPSNTASAPSDIPVLLRNGNISIGRVISGPITAVNTTGRIALRNNIFYLNNLRTTAFEGLLRGDISANLLNTALKIQVRGNGFNVEKALLALANMKDTLSGTASFDTDITLRGIEYTEQMKSLKGNVNFEIVDGQLGPFGKFENFLLAENIRESEFFQSTIGSVINSMTTVETSHYRILDGHLSFADGVVTLEPITSLGKVMCLHIGGNMNLLTNQADMKLRGRLASQVSDMLGPVAAVNPVNLVKVTPGLNVVAAKAFTLFCEQITQEELESIPDFEKDYSVMSTTKFQVVLRGDVAKPLSLVKSFKWLALASEIEQAQAFVATLPTPEEFERQQNPTKWEKFVNFFKKKKV